MEHLAVLLSCIKVPHGFKTFVLSIFEWLLKTGLTVIPFSCIKLAFFSFHFFTGSSHTRSNSNVSGIGESTESLYEILTSLAKLGIIMAYFYLCDR